MPTVGVKLVRLMRSCRGDLRVPHIRKWLGWFLGLACITSGVSCEPPAVLERSLAVAAVSVTQNGNGVSAAEYRVWAYPDESCPALQGVLEPVIHGTTGADGLARDTVVLYNHPPGALGCVYFDFAEPYDTAFSAGPVAFRDESEPLDSIQVELVLP